jgi:serine/threonine-protein kinase
VNREVALKQLRAEFSTDKDRRAGFVFEAEITGNLEHPGVVPIYGRGLYADGRPYYAMRFIRGDTLKRAVDRFHKAGTKRKGQGTRRREFQNLMRRFLVVCDTMTYVHNRGVIHRDLKPRNILLGSYGETLVVDWGMAKVVGHSEAVEPSDQTLRPPSSSEIQLTSPGHIKGTPAYMSPEQARGEVDRLGPASDIYSLGATLYYMLTARSPFKDESVGEVLRQVERGDFAPPREVEPGVDRALNAICLKAMSLEPKNRYATPRALADDLELWLADQPVSAYPEPLPARVMRWLRRRRQLVATAATLVLFSLVGLILYNRGLSRENARVSQQLRAIRNPVRQLVQVAAKELASIPQTGELRRTIGVYTLECYDALREQFPDDLDLQYESVRVCSVLSGIGMISGEYREPLELVNKGIKVLERLETIPEWRLKARQALAKLRIQRGELQFMSGKTAEAEIDAKSALAYIEKAANDSNKDTYRVVKASALINLCEIRLLSGRAEAAVDAADGALTLLKQLQSADDYLWLSALATKDRGAALRDRGIAKNSPEDAKAAISDVKNALAIARRIPAEGEEEADAQFQVASTINTLAKFHEDDPPPLAESLKLYDEAVTMLQSLTNRFSTYTFLREELVVALNGHCRVQLAEKRDAEALKDNVAAIQQLVILQQAAPDNPHYLSLHAEAKIAEAELSRRAGRGEERLETLRHARELLRRAADLDSMRSDDKARLEKLDAEIEALTGAGRNR